MRNLGTHWLITVLVYSGIFLPLDGFAQNKQLKPYFSALNIEYLSNQKAPKFELVTQDGDTVSIEKLQGRLAILHFWATWCKPCKQEMPELEQFSDRIKELNVSLLGISIDKSMDSLKIAEAVEEMGVTFPIAPAYSGKIKDAYWTWGIPVTYFIDPKGKIIGRMRGSGKWLNAKMFEFFKLLMTLNSEK